LSLYIKLSLISTGALYDSCTNSVTLTLARCGGFYRLWF
jgi:hypothetical protein